MSSSLFLSGQLVLLLLSPFILLSGIFERNLCHLPYFFSDLHGSDLCSITKTGISYQYKQEWYKCETCSFKDDEVVCKICIETCHKNHSVNYYGVTNGYCDCGAEVAGPCHALDKRGISFSF